VCDACSDRDVFCILPLLVGFYYDCDNHHKSHGIFPVAHWPRDIES